jgi:hypothetical protein
MGPTVLAEILSADDRVTLPLRGTIEHCS